MTDEYTTASPEETEVPALENELSEAPEPRRYELGYHLIPTITHEELDKAVSELKAAVAHVSGSVVSESAPVHTRLAYPMEYRTQKGKQQFENAHFGWLRADLTPQAADELHSALGANEHVLRFLLVHISPDAPEIIWHAQEREADVPKAEAATEEAAAGGEVRADASKDAAKLSDEELDRAVDELVEGTEAEKASEN